MRSNDVKVDLIFKTPTDGHYFFGYYDKPQLNKENDKLLALKVDFIDHVPTLNDVAIIGYFDLNDTGKFSSLASTNTFNWQQGCMAQWIGSDEQESIIYNNMVNGKLVSTILNIQTLDKQDLDSPIYTVARCGTFALTLDFERHYWCRRGYSYDGNYSSAKNLKVVKGDAIYKFEFDNSTSSPIVFLDDVMKIKPLSNMTGATHYLEHIMLNPSGSRFCFLHRWKIQDGGIYARFYTANTDGSDVFLLNDSGRMSHFFWKNDSEILAYGGLETRINSLRKYKNIIKYIIKPLLPLYHKIINDNSLISKVITGDSYIILTDKSSYKKRVASSLSSEDGHPSFAREGKKNLFVTDTYPDPDEGSIARLFLYNLDLEKEFLLAELNSISEYDNSPIRCDLHPRWSVDGEYITIDTMNDGVRGCYVYKLSGA